MRYLSVCSGIEAASVAWAPLGFSPVAFAEVEPFPCAVLARHYPDVPNLGDMTMIDGSSLRGRVHVLVRRHALPVIFRGRAAERAG